MEYKNYEQNITEKHKTRTKIHKMSFYEQKYKWIYTTI